jgi:hypothetical protein
MLSLPFERVHFFALRCPGLGLAADFDLAFRCCGGVFATAPAARSKRAHASGCSSILLGSVDLDMPQPINKIVPNPRVILDTDALKEKPELAILVVKIFAVWANIERRLSVLLVHLLGADQVHAHAIFSILQTQALQTKAMEAAAKSALSSDDLDIFDAVLTVVNGVQKTRNRLAHWAWGKCPQRPDLLVLADPDGLKEWDTRQATYFQSLEPGANPFESPARFQFDLSKIYGYSKADLEREVRDFLEAETIAFFLQGYLDPSFSLAHAKLFNEPDTPEAIRDQVFRQLNETRLFAEALAQIRARRKSTPPPPHGSNPPDADGSS